MLHAICKGPIELVVQHSNVAAIALYSALRFCTVENGCQGRDARRGRHAVKGVHVGLFVKDEAVVVGMAVHALQRLFGVHRKHVVVVMLSSC